MRTVVTGTVRAVATLLGATLGHALGDGEQGATRQLDAVVLVDPDDLDLNLVAELEHVGNLAGALVRDLGDAQSLARRILHRGYGHQPRSLSRLT